MDLRALPEDRLADLILCCGPQGSAACTTESYRRHPGGLVVDLRLKPQEIGENLKLIGIGAMDVTKPYKFVGVGPWMFPNPLNL